MFFSGKKSKVDYSGVQRKGEGGDLLATLAEERRQREEARARLDATVKVFFFFLCVFLFSANC